MTYFFAFSNETKNDMDIAFDPKKMPEQHQRNFFDVNISLGQKAC
jgi:hypothetical protein